MTVASDRHMARLRILPCVVCLRCYGVKRNMEEAHHIEFDRGEHSAFAVVPLCATCHDQLHAKRRRAFYTAHKLTDVKLMAWTAELLERA